MSTATTATAAAAPEFSSDGFDLDAISNSKTDVLEIGGGISKVQINNDDNKKETTTKNNEEEQSLPSEITKSEEYKKEGNTLFKQGLYLDAIDEYTNAIETCPYDAKLKGKDLLNAKLKHEQEQRDAAARKLQEERSKQHKEEREKRERGQQKDKDGNSDSTSQTSSLPKKVSSEAPYEPPKPLEIEEYKPPDKDGYGEKYLAVYYCNRAACRLHLKQYDAVIEDCTVSLLFKPAYTKALMRRSQAYENYYSNDNSTDNNNDDKFGTTTPSKTEDALNDAKKALEIEPTNKKILADVKRLETKHSKEMEILKEKTMGQLKDLGNSILGNFGLSLDNFQAKQDPNTGSYSINFNQNATK